MLSTLATVTVTGANTATVLSATRIPCHSFMFHADSGGGIVWVGDSNVASTGGSERGIPVAAGAVSPNFTNEISPNDLDLSKIYIASTNTASKVHVLYIEA